MATNRLKNFQQHLQEPLPENIIYKRHHPKGLGKHAVTPF